MLNIKTLIAAVILAVCSIGSNDNLAVAQNGAYLNVCAPGSDAWTLYESSQPGMFQQEFGLSGPGNYSVTVTANGFGFEGFAYTRDSAWDDWIYMRKTNAGEYTWSQNWQITHDDTKLFMLQLIKPASQCRGCTMTVTVRTSGCQSTPSSGSGSSRGPTCNPDQCYSGENALFGVGSCVARPGWDGSNCP